MCDHELCNNGALLFKQEVCGMCSPTQHGPVTYMQHHGHTPGQMLMTQTAASSAALSCLLQYRSTDDDQQRQKGPG